MSSFSCPHLDSENTFCIKLNVDCVPGRKGCVLNRKFQFAFPPEDRIKNKNKAQSQNRRFTN
ncbi:MAG: hypothetical protein OQJ81_07720 [Melioribacteraceae bacterium]|nr:hypothetical protein [Melioribacteraceae bacterium]